MLALLAVPAPSSLLLICNHPNTMEPITLEEFQNIVPDKPGNVTLKRFEVQEFVSSTMWSTVWTRDGGMQQSSTPIMVPPVDRLWPPADEGQEVRDRRRWTGKMLVLDESL